MGQILVDRHGIAGIDHEFPQGQHRGGLEFFGADVISHIIARVADHGTRFNIVVYCFGRLFGHRDEIQGLSGGDGVVEGVRGGDGADQDQHDQPHTLLPVI